MTSQVFPQMEYQALENHIACHRTLDTKPLAAPELCTTILLGNITAIRVLLGLIAHDA